MRERMSNTTYSTYFTDSDLIREKRGKKVYHLLTEQHHQMLNFSHYVDTCELIEGVRLVWYAIYLYSLESDLILSCLLKG